MAFKLNSLVCVWRTASLAHLNLNINRGRQLGYLLLSSVDGGGGGGVKQLISFSSPTYSPSSWSLVSRSSCSYCFTNIGGNAINPRNHPLLSSKAPCMLIPSPKEDEVIASITKELGKGTGNEVFRFPDFCFYSLAHQKLVSLNNVRRKSNIFIPNDSICIGSSHGWLAYIDPHDSTIFLTNPLVSPVPPTIRLPPLETNQQYFDSCNLPYIKKLVMSSPPSTDDNNNNCCIVMVKLNIDSCLAFCKLGDTSWTFLEDYENKFIPVDLVYSNKDQLFYCEQKFSLHAWNLRNPSSPRRIDIKAGHLYGTPDFPESEKELRDYNYHYLAFESHSGDVLLVKKFMGEVADDGTIIDYSHSDSDSDSFKTLRFAVYRLNTIKRGWDYVTDLGDGVLFIGLNHAFHLSANDFATGVLIPNSIYFNTDYECHYYDMGIYNMQDFTVKSIFPSHLQALNNIEHHHPPIWFTPNPENK